MYRLIPAILAGLLIAAPMAAQGPVPDANERARLQAELARVDAQIEALTARKEARSENLETRLESSEARRVVHQLGPIRIEGTQPMLDGLVPVFEAEWAALEAQLGDLSFVPPMRIDLVSALNINQTDLRPAANHRRIRWFGDLENGPGARGELREMVRDAVPSLVRSWTQGVALTMPASIQTGYQALLSTIHPAGISCAQEADVDACLSYLFVDYDATVETNRAAIDGWYRDQYQLASAANSTSGWAQAGAENGCRLYLGGEGPDTFDRSACITYLSQPRFIMNAVPSHVASRGAVLQMALDLDPDGRGLTRSAALPDNASIADHLEAIARIPARDLVSQWQNGLTVSVDGPVGGAGGPGPFTLLWAGAFALFSLRSTRWRLG